MEKIKNSFFYCIKADVRRMWHLFRAWWHVQQKAEVMYVTYDITNNRIESYDWISQKIPAFSGQFSSVIFNEIKEYCRLGDFPHTTIYIWAGMERKHLAYHEPIENYLTDENLWRTGQGFDYKSGLRYGQKSKRKCPCCGRHYA